ncbi:MAG: mannonate dehydratase [Devosia sp.]|nr:mannonate dehydratase [Devosia sp.]
MEQTWRWFGENDPVTLDSVRQAGATGIVTALRDIPPGEVWSPDRILRRKQIIEAAGLRWSVCESIMMPNAIKLGDAQAPRAIAAWTDTLANLGRAGIRTVCYNFMPVVDWTRTDLVYPMPSTGLALRFDMVSFVGYDVFVLRRPGAGANYPPALVEAAQRRIAGMGPDDIARLEANIIRGLPGGEASYDRASIGALIAQYAGLDDQGMRANLVTLLRAVTPVAEEFGIRLAIHPDDPPFSLFGLPRIVSTAADMRAILAAVDSPSNGMTLCTGSYGSRPDNDVLAIAGEFAGRIHFAHLRNVTCEPDGSFFEDGHLDGGTDMVAVIDILLREENRRRAGGDTMPIPLRPDHGHLLADDIGKTVNPGYSFIGRLKGLAEIRGVVRALEHPGRHA